MKKGFIRLSDKLEHFATFEDATFRKTYFDCEMIVDLDTDTLWVAWADERWEKQQPRPARNANGSLVDPKRSWP